MDVSSGDIPAQLMTLLSGHLLPAHTQIHSKLPSRSFPHSEPLLPARATVKQI